jgi:uncharacterized membrane protein
MMILAVASGVFLILELTTNPTHAESLWYANVDLTISLIFLTEFTIKFFLVRNKKEYFRTNWWYLLASVPAYGPVFHALESLQLLRFIRLIRLIRVTTGVREIHDYFERYTKPGHLLGAFTLCLIVIFYGAILFYTFESGVNPHISTVPDSVAWVASTVATVGYGDIHPTTVGGRVIGIIAMLSGVLAICILSALAASLMRTKKKRR